MKQQCKIKFCGIRRLEDVTYMNEFMPDYVGFVFAPSRRQVSPAVAMALGQELHSDIKRVGVFVNEPYIAKYCRRHKNSTAVRD